MEAIRIADPSGTSKVERGGERPESFLYSVQQLKMHGEKTSRIGPVEKMSQRDNFC